MTVLLFDVFGDCSVEWIIRGMENDRFNGIFDVKECLEDFDGFAVILGKTAANENMAVMRGEDKIVGSLKADALVGTCTVLATEL